MHQYPQSMPEGSETVSITRTPAASTCRRSGRAVRHNPWWKYPVTGDENETDLFGGASAAYNRGAMVQITVRPPLDAADDRVFGGLVRGRTAIRHHASGRAAVGAFVRRTLAGLSFLAAWLRRERSLWGNDGRNR